MTQNFIKQEEERIHEAWLKGFLSCFVLGILALAYIQLVNEILL